MPDDAAAPGHPLVAATVQDEIGAGLTARLKTLPAKLFYDEAGCALFGEITRLPEYYVTRAEMRLLDRHAAEIAREAPPGAALVEYGASDEAKGVRLLDADARFAAYVPVDIAPVALADIASRMAASHPAIAVTTIAADFLQPLLLPGAVARMPGFGFFPGSTIGNFRPPMVRRFLGIVRETLGDTADPAFVVGTDLRKDPARLVPAYDDAAGVTAAFNRNILLHVNRLTGAAFDPDSFAHRVIWNAHEGRIEMHLQSRAAQTVMLLGQRIAFAAGETIHTEDSYKHSRESFLALATQAGWRSGGFWTDPDGLFGMHLLRG